MSASPFDRLADHLSQVESTLRPWLSRPRCWPLREEQRITLEEHANDLARQARELQEERPSIVVVLMGGTGVGKSTLLNALAQGTIAEAYFTRPTTREPIVYLHQQFNENRLDPALRSCRLIRHQQAGLEYKILVDTPDLDSNETLHRERLIAVLPAADVILYVGSQEKYHDIAGWELFLQHKDRRAFAFVLNKWDRCVAQHATGISPDEDLLRDLQVAGFHDPLLFRVCAHAWLEGPPREALPPGEQFPALRSWLEQGLTQREMNAIRTQGVAQLLMQLEEVLTKVTPPDVQQATARTTERWLSTLQNEIATQADILLAQLVPHQKTLERRFASHISHPFTGLMGKFASFLNMWEQGIWSSRLPQVKPALGEMVVSDLEGFAHSCSRECYSTKLAARNTSLVDRLVAEADNAGLPTQRLAGELQAQLSSITEASYADAAHQALSQAEKTLAGPQSWRQRMAGLWTRLGQYLPVTVAGLLLAWQLYAKFSGSINFSITDILLLPILAAILVMVLLYILYRRLVPVTWNKLVGPCRESLVQELRKRFQLATQALPQQQATLLADERQQVLSMLNKVRQAQGLITEQEKTANVAILYSR